VNEDRNEGLAISEQVALPATRTWVNIDFSGRVAAILSPPCPAGEEREAGRFRQFPSAAKDSDLRPSYSRGRLTGWR